MCDEIGFTKKNSIFFYHFKFEFRFISIFNGNDLKKTTFDKLVWPSIVQKF